VPTLVKSLRRFCVVTWNARVLLAKDPRKRRAKLRVLDRILLSANVVFIQELHGTLEEASLALFRYVSDWQIHLNSGTDRNTGS
jgi:hypothetical protein